MVTNPPDPLVVRIVRAFKAGLLAQEQVQMAEMAARWFQIERRLNTEFEALALEIELRNQAGERVPISRLVRMDRYRSLLAQTHAELRGYTDYADTLISGRQREWGRLGLVNAGEAIQASYAGAGQVIGAFNVLPVDAIEAMVGLAGDGSPLRALLKDSWPDAVNGLTRALIEATTLGKNPRDTAQAMANGFGVGLDRAMVIARTEQLRAYREANRMQYQASKLVEGYKRISARDSRVCPACLFADDGTVYPLEQYFEEHPQGRCASVPVVIGIPAVTWQDGSTWFTAQSPEVQKDILGEGRFQAWQDGLFDLSDVVKRRENETWGASLVSAPLSELVK